MSLLFITGIDDALMMHWWFWVYRVDLILKRHDCSWCNDDHLLVNDKISWRELISGPWWWFWQKNWLKKYGWRWTDIGVRVKFIVISETLFVVKWFKLSLTYVLAVHLEGEGNTSTQISKLECDMLNVKLEDGNCELVSMKVCIVRIVAVPHAINSACYSGTRVSD